MERLSQSPDRNTFENCWQELKIVVHAFNLKGLEENDSQKTALIAAKPRSIKHWPMGASVYAAYKILHCLTFELIVK